MRSPIRELDYPNLLSGFSFLNEPENTAKMDRNKRLPVTPLMFFSLILSLSIITARYSYDYFSTRYWLIAAIIAIALAGCCYVLHENRQLSRLFFRKIKQLVLLQSLLLSLCLFCLGGFITSHHIDKTKTPGSIMTYQSLSPIARTILASRSFRQQLEQQLHTYHIDGQDFAVISAMAMGDKGSLDRETKESFSISGTSHILAVSGLHIGIIFQLFVILLGGKRRSRPTIALSLVAVWAYVVFIGFPPSAVRSASMLSIYSFCLLALRPDLSLNTLALAYVIMLFLNPFHLFDISFQMSFLAVASILIFYPPLFGLLKSHGKIIRCLWGLFPGGTDRYASAHRLLFRQNILLLPAHQLHRHPGSHPHPLSLCPTPAAFSHYLHFQPCLRRHLADATYSSSTCQHYPSHPYRLPAYQSVAGCQHRPSSSVTPSVNASLSGSRIWLPGPCQMEPDKGKNLQDSPFSCITFLIICPSQK